MEGGCEARSYIRIGHWKMKRDSIIFTCVSSESIDRQKIDLESFNISYPEITYMSCSPMAFKFDPEALILGKDTMSRTF